MPCASATCPQPDGRLQDFHNQHPHSPSRVYRPTTKQELVRAVLDAEAAGLSIRAIGTDMALSLSSVTGAISPAGTAPGATIQTDGLDRHVLKPLGATVSTTFVDPADPNGRLRAAAGNDRNLADAVLPEILAQIDPLTGGSGAPFLVYVEGGMKIRQLLLDLSQMTPALAVPAMGALSRQSVVGALATGTHGAEIDRQPLADAIRAVHLVGPGGQEWWIERTNGWSIPGTLETVVPEWCSETRVIRDDDLFYAAITGVGRLGVVYAVVLEVERDYWLLERRQTQGESWPMVRGALLTSIAAGYSSTAGIFTTRGNINFLQIALNPNDPTLCWTMQRKRVPPSTPMGLSGGGGSPLGTFCHPQDFADLAVEVDVLARPLLTAIAAGTTAAIGLVVPDPLVVSLANLGAVTWVNVQLSRIRNLILASSNLGEMMSGVLSDYPFLVPMLTSLLLKTFTAIDPNGPNRQFKRGRAFQVMDQTDYTTPTDCYFGVGSEYIFNAQAPGYLGFVNALFTSAATLGGIPGYISLRFVPQTDAYLGMERWPLSVAIEIGSLTPWAAAIPYLTAAQSSALALGGIPHWGQWLNEPLPTPTSFRSSLDAFRYAVATLEDGRTTSFRTPFSAAQALDPPSLPLATIAAQARPRVSVKELIAAGATLVPSFAPPTSLRAVGRLYKSGLRMNATGEALPAGRAAAQVQGVRARDLARRLL
jgi:hypothetical protein